MSAASPFSASVGAPIKSESSPGSQAPLTPDDLGTVPVLRSGVVLLLALVIGLVYWFNPPLNLQSQAGVLMNLPIMIGDYSSKEGEVTQFERDLLPKDTEFARRYYDDGHGHEVNCSIVLSGAEQRSIHRPEGCLTGQGWTILGEKVIPIPLLSGHPLKAEEISLERRVTDQNGGAVVIRAFYDYWFVGQNVTTPSEMERVLLSNWDRVLHNRAHRWAYVSVFSLVTDNLRPDGLNADQTRTLLVDFTKQIVPTFQISEMPSQAKN